MGHARFDVVVVGAGVAGSACARFLAEGGLRVALVDRRAMAKAGARWVNGVPARAFDQARIARPQPPELRGAGHRFIVASPSGRTRIALDGDNPVMEVDMRHLGQRMRDGAKVAGATLIEETPVEGVSLDGGRPVALDTPAGRLEARLFVDASGLPAVVRRAVFPRWPDVARAHLCLAGQEVCKLADVAAARAYLAQNDLRSGDVHALTGTHGGYSVVNLRVDLPDHEGHEGDTGEVSLLTGAVPDSGTTGAAMIEELQRAHAWIGERVFGGAGALPLRRPYARLTAPGLVLLGDAGSQMFPAHGSGIAIGLRAARLLADVVLEAGPTRLGDEDASWSYAMRFHREHGGTLAGYDLVRRMAQAFSRDDAEALYDTGLITHASVLSALRQELFTPSPAELMLTAKAALRAPLLAAKVLAVFAKIPLLVANARTYPSKPDLSALASYEKRTAMVFDETPDPVD
ncbi:MAG: FAD-dependent oxidoreductase [Polyangiales bacterium]